MDGKTKLTKLYIAKNNSIALNEKNAENYDKGLNDTQDQGEHGTIIELINIGIVKEPPTISYDDDVQE